MDNEDLSPDLIPSYGSGIPEPPPTLISFRVKTDARHPVLSMIRRYCAIKFLDVLRYHYRLWQWEDFLNGLKEDEEFRQRAIQNGFCRMDQLPEIESYVRQFKDNLRNYLDALIQSLDWFYPDEIHGIPYNDFYDGISYIRNLGYKESANNLATALNQMREFEQSDQRLRAILAVEIKMHRSITWENVIQDLCDPECRKQPHDKHCAARIRTCYNDTIKPFLLKTGLLKLLPKMKNVHRGKGRSK